MDDLFMKKVDRLRETCGFPLKVTSGYRCPVHNSLVSSTGFSGPHTTGLSVDLQVSGKQAHKLLQEAVGLGFRGIGVNQRGNHSSRFIHLDDIEAGNRPWVWSY